MTADFYCEDCGETINVSVFHLGFDEDGLDMWQPADPIALGEHQNHDLRLPRNQ